MNPLTPAPVAAIVTGMEHSCTTHLSRMIMLHPRVNAGFECGLLLADQPGGFPKVQPFYDWMRDSAPAHRWNLTGRGLSEVCEAEDWSEAYQRIVRHSPLFQHGADLLLDKTPAYVRCLHPVLSKVPGVPCIVAVKDKLLQYYSCKQRGWSLWRFARYYLRARNSLRLAQRHHAPRLMFVHQEDLVANPWKQLLRIYGFVGLSVPTSPEFAARVRQQNDRHASQPGQPAYDYESVVRNARSAIPAIERRLLAMLPDLCDG